MKSLRRHRTIVGTFLCALLLSWQVAQPLHAVTYYWDTDGSTVGNDSGTGVGLGGTGTWDISTGNWWDTASLGSWVNGSGNIAVFSGPAVAIPTLNTVTLTSGLIANQVQFNRSGYTLAGGDLTLAGTGAGLFATLGDSATISSVIAGSDGLTKTGGGTIRLTGANTYTGTTTIANGSLIIGNAAALGGTGAVSILTTNQTPLNTVLYSFGGGSLVLDGTSSGFTFSRDINFEGRGPIGERGSAILSLGNNTLSGVLTSAVSPLPLSPTATIRNSRISSVNGTLTLSGTVNSGGTSATTFLNFGGINSAGTGNYDLTGVLAGTGSIEKSGGGTLFLNPSSTSGFLGTVRVSGSGTGQESTVRVSQLTVGGTSIFGANTGTNASAAIDWNGGVLEFRNEGSLDFNSLSSGKNVYQRASSTMYAGPGVGGEGVNGTVTLGTLRVAANTTATFNSRNGYGFTLQTWTQESSNNNNTVTNNLGGTLLFTGNVWNNDDGSARTLSISGNGNTTITGNINTSGAGNKVLTKNDGGTLTINGTGTTLNAGVNITNGEVVIRDFRSLNNNTHTIALGSGGNTVALLVGSGVAATAAGLTTSKVINLIGTTGSANLYANQAEAFPVILNANLVSTGVGAKTLTLGGTSAQENIINGAIPNAGVAFTPSASLTSGGTVITFASTTGMAVGQYVSGTGIQTGTTIAAITPTTITLSLPTTADRAASDNVNAANGAGAAVSLSKVGSGTWVLGSGANSFTGSITISNGTLKLKANSATSTIVDNTVDVIFDANNVFAGGTLELVGQTGVNNVETLDVLTPTNGANTIRLAPGSGGTASMVFGSLGTLGDGATVNIVGSDATNTITLTGQSGLNANPRLFFGGADFAIGGVGGVMRAPVYGTDTGFVNAAAGTALPAGADSFSINGNITAQGSQTVDTLKFNGAQTLTLNTGATLTVRTGAANTDGAILATGGASTITGGTGISTGGSGSLTIYVNGVSDSLTLNTILTSGTTGGLTKSGAGTLVLAQNNALTGTVSLNEGTIQLSGSGDLGGGNALTMRQGTIFDLNGVTPASNINAFNNNGTVINSNATAVTLTVGGSNGTGSSLGGIDQTNGVINVTKLGTGGQSWLGLSNYTGVTTIGSTGLVTVDYLADIGQDSGIGRGVATDDATNAASLVFNGSTGGLVYRGDRLNGNLTIGDASASTNRLFTLAGTGARLSSTAGLNNAIIWSNTGAIVHGIVGPQLLTLEGDSTGDNTFNPQLTDSGTGADITRLTKSGTGQWNLGNSNNTYTGITTVSNGILALNDNGALPTNSPVVLGTSTTNGILQMSGNFARNLTTTAAAGTGTITWGGTTGGGGFAAHTTSLTVTLNSGAGLAWGSGGFVPTGASLVFGSSSALSDVTFTNAIDLGAASRTVTVNNNGNTGADFATMTGVLSGAGGGLVKAGSGILRLTAANTYTGVTAVTGGTLVVTSLGNSADALNTPTSVGVSGVAFDTTNAITLGNGTTANSSLQYTGGGEVSDRQIRINGSTSGTTSGGAQIHADGSGPLILTNVTNDMVAGTATRFLWLRGNNTAGNMITSQLSDNGSGVLGVTIDGAATWILTNPGNNYTGTTTVGSGALGIGHDTAIGAALTISNGNVFAHGGDRTLTNTLNMGNNASSAFLGDHSITFNGTNNLAAGANNINLYNSIVTGEALTFNGLQANSLTATRAWSIGGNGETIINGNFTTSTAFGVNITYSGNGILNLGTNGATSNWNQAGSPLDLDRGTLKFSANNAIPTTASSTGLTISPEIATFDTATVNLNGTTQTINALTATTDGTVIIDNTAATAAAFRFGANNSAVNFGSGIGNYTITDSGAGALSIVKLGNTSTTFSAGLTLTYQGATRVEGGSLTVASPVNGTNALEVVNIGSTLALTGGITTPSAITGVVVENMGTLNLLDGAGSQMTNLTTLQLGSTGGTMTTLNLNVGDSLTPGDELNTDLFSLLTGGTLNLFAGNKITFNLTDAGLNANQTYVLLDASAIGGGLLGGPLNIADYILGGTPGGFTSIDITTNSTTNQIILTTGNLITGDLFWRGLAGGGTSTAWNGNANNWSQDKANTTPSISIPGQGTDVIFAIDSASGAVTTTLEQNFKINSLTFEAGTSTPTSVAIDPGASPTNRLEIAPQTATDGIEISTGGPPAVTISAPLRIGKDQTWTVADSAAILTLSGGLQGEADVTKAGSGKVILSGVADPTFNGGQTAIFTVNAGNLEFTNSAALGTTANSNVASIVVSGGGFYYNNASAGTAATLPHAITLNGGALSGGGANHVYGGPISVSGASTINMADSNGPITATARNITLAGVVSGTGSLTINSNNTDSGGNQLGGTLTINNATSTWSGDLIFNRGTVTIAATSSGSVTPDDVTFNSFGRLLLQGVDGQTINRAGLLTLAAGAVGEFQVDNTTTTQITDFTVNQNGSVALGSGGTGAILRVALPDQLAKFNIAGNVLLGGNSSISVSNSAARLFTISGVISDGGNGYGLAINDDAGGSGWAQTNGVVRLTGANTFTGNISLGGGTLEFNTVTNISGGASALGNGTAITSTANATLRFIGTTAQSTNRPINSTAGVLTLSANGATAADTISYGGAITVGPTADGSQIILTGAAGREGIIAGGITQTGDEADITVSGGTWTHQTGTSRIGDDGTVTGATTILNLNSGLFQVRDDFTVTAGATLNLNGAGVLSFNTPTLSSGTLRATNGGIINLGSNAAVVTTEFDELRIGVDGGGAAGILNLGGFNLTANAFILGNRQLDREGTVNGTTGVLTVTGNLDLYEGTINGNLASTGSETLDKFGLETVTLAGDNSGLASTGASVISEGTLALDYTASNTTKLRAASALDMRGGTLLLIGNNSAATSQSVGSFTLGSNGSSTINMNPGTGQTLVLNLNAITRAVNAQDGTIRFNLPTGTQNSTNGITTDTLNTIGTGANAILGGWATVNDGTGVFFARNVPNVADGNIGAAVTTATDAVGSWVTGENITDSTGFSGSLSSAFANSLRFDAVVGSDVTLTPTGVLGVNSGGILVTNNVGGSPSITGGTIFSGAQASNVPELIIIQDSAATFELGADLRTNSTLVKSGTGTVLLSGNNTYTGNTDIQEGTAQLSGGNSIGDASLVTLSATRNSMIQLLNNETIGRLQGGLRADGADLGIVDLGGNILTINQTSNTTFAGRFTGTGTIVLNAGSTSNLATSGQSTGFTGSVIVNGGLFHLSAAGSNSASSFTINNLGYLLMDKNSTTTSGDQIGNSAAINLNSAIGSTTVAGGLWIRRDQGSTQSETVGDVTAASGASYVRAETSAANAITVLSANNVLRDNNATLVIRGNNMAAASGRRAQFRIIAANETAFIGSMIGGAGAAGTVTTSIVPWAIAEDAGSAAIAVGNMGNSLTTYTATTGFRPLNIATEYATYATAGATNNTRESLNVSLTGLAGRTLNSLVIDNNNTATINVTGSGAGQTLSNTSGAFLFTITSGVASTAYSTFLGGFDSGIAVGGSEYVFHVVNPSYAATTPTLTVTVASALTSAADITKSGRGTLVLNQINTAGGGTRKTTLNEGVLEIADLDNIGGGTGGLIFAGGTLRLGAGFVDDLSTRTISFLNGGGTLDTNGIDLALAGSLGSGVGGFTKIGAGNLTLNSAATYTGNSVLAVGTVTVGANNALGNGGNLTLSAGTTLDLGANSLSHGLVTTSGASPQITGTGTITASAGFFLNHTGDTTIDAVLAGSGGLLKAQANAVTLTGDSTYTGTTEVQAGTLIFDSVTNVGGGASALGNPTTAESGIIRMGLTTAATTLTYTGSGHSTDRIIGMQGTTGGANLAANGTGAIIYTGGVRFENAGNKTLTLRGTSDPAIINQIQGLSETGGVLTLAKADSNTWMVNGGNTYTGQTQVDNGTLRIGLTNALPVTTTVRIGTGGTAGTFDLNGFNQTIGSLLVQTNSNLVTNNLIVDSGNTLTVNGAVTIGVNANESDTNFNATGGGAIVVNSGGANFQLGAATVDNENRVDVDFTGLSSFTANLGTGTFRIGDANTGTGNSTSNFKLATDNVITAASIRIGDGTGGSNLHTLTLGSGTNELNADTINVGSAGATIRSSGLINFDAGDTTGEVTIRGSLGGSSRANINLVNTTGSTAGDISGTLDFEDHTANILANLVTMASRTQNTGDATATLLFNQGNLDVTTLNMASRTGSGAGEATATTTIGGGNVIFGTLNMAVNTSSGAGSTSTATLNISGGTTTIGTGSGTAINMANAGTGRTVTSNINLTGGTVDVTGNIVRTGGLGTENTTVTLNGATLDMNGFSIGSSTAAIVFNAQMGTLENLAELNGGTTPLTKTTAGTLVMQGNNTYTGGTNINAGIVQVNSAGALGSTGSIAFGGGTLQYTANNTTDYSSRFSTAASQAYSIDTNGQSVTYATDLSSSGGTLTKLGAGTLVLSAANTYSGATTVSGGILQVGDGTTGNLAGTGAVGISSGATLSGSGSIAGAVTVNAGGFLAPGVGSVATSNQTLTLTNAGGLTVANSGQITVSISSPSNASLLTFANGQYTFNSTNYATAALLFAAEPTALATWNTSPASVSNHDYIHITSGGLSLGDRSGSGYGNGSFVVTDNGFLSGSPAYGQVFNLIDWMGAMTGNFDLAGSTFGDGSSAFGDLDLPTLTGGLAWDVTAFQSYGIVVVVPEPSRVLLLLFGLLGFMLRRRRSGV